MRVKPKKMSDEDLKKNACLGTRGQFFRFLKKIFYFFLKKLSISCLVVVMLRDLEVNSNRRHSRPLAPLAPGCPRSPSVTPSPTSPHVHTDELYYLTLSQGLTGGVCKRNHDSRGWSVVILLPKGDEPSLMRTTSKVAC